MKSQYENERIFKSVGTDPWNDTRTSGHRAWLELDRGCIVRPLPTENAGKVAQHPKATQRLPRLRENSKSIRIYDYSLPFATLNQALVKCRRDRQMIVEKGDK